jgi:hypothetical protein
MPFFAGAPAAASAAAPGPGTISAYIGFLAEPKSPENRLIPFATPAINAPPPKAAAAIIAASLNFSKPCLRGSIVSKNAWNF